MIAKEKGLEPLLTKILDNASQINDLNEVAKDFVTAPDANVEPGLKVLNEKEALAGASDIFAENTAETADIRSLVREISQESGTLVSKKVEGAGNWRKKVRNRTPRNTKITSIMRSQLIPQHHIESWLSGGEEGISES